MVLRVGRRWGEAGDMMGLRIVGLRMGRGWREVGEGGSRSGVKVGVG